MIRLQKTPLNIEEEIHRAHMAHPAIGALASFAGFVRPQSDGHEVKELFLEHYPPMTQKALESLQQDAVARWSLELCVIIHRIGAMKPHDPIVLVLAGAVRRKPALAAVDFIMDRLKTTIPLWKKETRLHDSRWIAPTATDIRSANAWNKS